VKSKLKPSEQTWFLTALNGGAGSSGSSSSRSGCDSEEEVLEDIDFSLSVCCELLDACWLLFSEAGWFLSWPLPFDPELDFSGPLAFPLSPSPDSDLSLLAADPPVRLSAVSAPLPDDDLFDEEDDEPLAPEALEPCDEI